MDASTALKWFLSAGAAGWALENVAHPPRYSKALGGSEAKVPFLPVYAVGGLTLALLAPTIKNLPVAHRAVIYGAALTALELGAGVLDEAAGGPPSWDYGGLKVDPAHFALWAFLGLMVEGYVWQAEPSE